MWHMPFGKKIRHGFTLIELLVVMVIIASLLAIAVPRYFKSLDHSKEVVLLQDLAVMRDALDQFYEDRGEYPETLLALEEERYIRKVPVDPMTKSSETWTEENHPDHSIPGIYDIHSGSEGTTQSGTPHAAL